MKVLFTISGVLDIPDDTNIKTNIPNALEDVVVNLVLKQVADPAKAETWITENLVEYDLLPDE